eukprot:1479131-Pyramimonas_sp.AAC.1
MSGNTYESCHATATLGYHRAGCDGTLQFGQYYLGDFPHLHTTEGAGSYNAESYHKIYPGLDRERS